eukprot:NODE_797_length_1186_cov_116.177526_g756_i0.p1 GENE.NODE_797_length_1186_cov_116.177526_g756_i0~~NODE_797_length_1186_cov_116.177526_g756_i0.p1  ORF type:complete len:368 (+),score=38.82 NODE_797_length_1186_cov_116.177526_g756_i0:40-1143(+)
MNSSMMMGTKPQLIILVLVGLLLAVCSASAGHQQRQQRLYATIAFCPDYFSARGAVVEIIPETGEYSIVRVFLWPPELSGFCPYNHHPIVARDEESSTIFMQFNNAWGMVVHLDVPQGNITHVSYPDDIFFHGYVNMGYEDQIVLKGVTPTVTQNGFCSNGCFGFGALDPFTGVYSRRQEIPFKAALNFAHFYDTHRDSYYIQMSYDLRETICGNSMIDQCLVELDATTGAVKSAVGPLAWTGYKYSSKYNNETGDIFTWVSGFQQECEHSRYSYAFADVNLPTGEAEPVSCLPDGVTVFEQPWVSDFSTDATLFVTGSGNIYGHRPQVLVVETSSGSIWIDADLDGLAEELGAQDGLFVIWSVNFV